MKSQKQDSVQGFLTSTKLLTSKMKPNNKSKVNKSVIQTLLSNNQEQSYLTTPRDKKQKQTNKLSLIQPIQTSSRKQQSNQNYGDQYYNQSRNDEKSISQQYENNFIFDDQEQRESKRSSQKSKSRRSSKYKPIGPYGTSEESQKRQLSQQKSDKKQSQNRNFIMPMKKNPQISQLQVKELINKIVHLKSSLEIQISELQHLLDSTSNYLESIDEQFQKIKQKILIFTSQSLDAAFKQYKNNFPDWSKYENVEHEALSKLSEINQIVEGFRQGKQGDEFANSYELQKRIESYNILIKDVEGARNECSNLRPKITEERLKKFQNSVFEIGKF